MFLNITYFVSWVFNRRSISLNLSIDLRARGSTQRSEALPMGDARSSAVHTGNVMVARCCLLILLAAARGVWIILEQPKGSLLQYHPAFVRVTKLIRMWRKFVKMGDFGAMSEKGTWLYSSWGPKLLTE